MKIVSLLVCLLLVMVGIYCIIFAWPIVLAFVIVCALLWGLGKVGRYLSPMAQMLIVTVLMAVGVAVMLGLGLGE